MNPENIQKHLLKINEGIQSMVINSLAQSLAQANSKIEELEAKIKELEKPKDNPQSPVA